MFCCAYQLKVVSSGTKREDTQTGQGQKKKKKSEKETTRLTDKDNYVGNILLARELAEVVKG